MSNLTPTDHRMTDESRADYGPDAYPLVPEAARDGVVAFLSSTERNGRWTLPRHLRAVSVMGNVELDLRDATIGIGVSLIEAVAVMGSIEITIPPDVAVECDGDSLLGSFVVKYKGGSSGMATRLRTVRIVGTAYASSVEITIKGPDEGILRKLRKYYRGHPA